MDLGGGGEGGDWGLLCYGNGDAEILWLKLSSGLTKEVYDMWRKKL